jgi:hypothetical protein
MEFENKGLKVALAVARRDKKRATEDEAFLKDQFFELKKAYKV